MKNNLILIGLPGAGKSTVGVLLAKMRLMHFLDTDLLIQTNEGMALSEIIAKAGKKEFLTLEDKTLSSLAAENTVIATGGSAVYGEGAMAHLATLGRVIYLKIGFETLSARVGDLDARGVVGKAASDLAGIWQERIPLYERYADLTVSAEFDRPEMAALAIIEALGEDL